MEIEIAEKLGDLLLNNTAVTAVIGNRFSPLYADENVNPPLITYVINEGEPPTKDGMEQYDVFLALVFPKKGYTACMDMKKKVKAALHGSEFDFKGSDVSLDEDNLNVVCVLRFETFGISE